MFSCKGVIGSIEYPVQHQEMQDEDEGAMQTGWCRRAK